MKKTKYLIAGSGAIGSSIGGFLLKSGVDIRFIARGNHKKMMKKKGLKISGIWGNHLISNINFFNFSSEINFQPDVIFLTVKSYDTEKMVKELFKHFPNSYIVSLQNGLGNWEIIEKFYPKNKIIGGRVIYGAEIVAPGHVKISVIADDTLLGSPYNIYETNIKAKDIIFDFKKAELPSRFEENIESYLWGKVLYNNALNPLGAILESNYGPMADDKSLKKIMKEIIIETYKIGNKLGIRFILSTADEYFDYFINKQIPPTYNHFPSMFYDLKHRGKTEIDSLNGAISKAGRKFEIATPVNDLLTAQIKFLEKKYKQ